MAQPARYSSPTPPQPTLHTAGAAAAARMVAAAPACTAAPHFLRPAVDWLPALPPVVQPTCPLFFCKPLLPTFGSAVDAVPTNAAAASSADALVQNVLAWICLILAVICATISSLLALGHCRHWLRDQGSYIFHEIRFAGHCAAVILCALFALTQFVPLLIIAVCLLVVLVRYF